MRFQLIHELRAVVESIEILRGATVEPFGSFVSNLFTRWGDVDISIELPNGLHISAAGKKYKLSLLGDVLKALRAKECWPYSLLALLPRWMPKAAIYYQCTSPNLEVSGQ